MFWEAAGLEALHSHGFRAVVFLFGGEGGRLFYFFHL